jgi:NADH-quinone oxidoreductase subunit J
MKTFFFYFLSLCVLLSAYAVVTVRNLFRSAIGLITLLLGIAGLYLLIDAQFLSAVQISVYIGGIVVLIVYVVLLVSDVARKIYPKRPIWRQVSAGALALGFFLILVAAMTSIDLRPAPGVVPRSASVAEIGQALLSPDHGGFVLPFEIISLVLVAAIVGAITIAHGGTQEAQSKAKD